MLKRGFNMVGTTVAINGQQWDEGMNCGRCVRVSGTGEGIGTTPVFGPIYATVDNVCSECKHGDIDLGLSGDGIWKITWDFVDCSKYFPSLPFLILSLPLTPLLSPIYLPTHTIPYPHR